MKSKRLNSTGKPIVASLLFALALIGFSPAHALTNARIDAEHFSPFGGLDARVQQSWTRGKLTSYSALTGGLVSLVDYIRANIEPEPRDQMEAHLPRYNRLQSFGHWLNADPKVNCLDTRQEVLVRDAEAGSAVTARGPSGCVVTKGVWHDPYTGETFKMPRALQIDHVVPLKNAWLSGAYQWRFARRCHYANYLGNAFHLLAVSGHENMAKGGKGPEEYMPPNPAFQCQYLEIWMKIKAIWGMSVSDDEAKAIESDIEQFNCRKDEMVIASDELRDQRAKSEDPVEKCVKLEAELTPATSK